MLNLEKILKQDRQIRTTTGLNRQAFEALLPSFEEAYQQMLMKKRRWRTLDLLQNRKHAKLMSFEFLQ